MIKKTSRDKLEGLINRAAAQELSWNDLFSAFDEKTIESDEMEEILLELEKRGINVIDSKANVEDLSTDDYVYVKMNVSKIKDCVPTLKKYKDGDIFCDYLCGKKISQIAQERSIEKADAIRRVKKFARCVSCWDLEKNCLAIFLEYRVTREVAEKELFLDLETFKFLNARSYAIPIDEYKKYVILEKYRELVKKLEAKEDL